MTSAFDQLKEDYAEIADIDAALAVLAWDQQTYMPPGGSAWRGNVMGTLAALRHERFLDPRFDAHLSGLKDGELTSDQQAFVAEFNWSRDRARRLPEEFVRECARVHADSFNAWVEAKRSSKFEIYRPHLEKVVELARRASDYWGFAEHPLDAHIASHERELNVRLLRGLLGELRTGTVALLKRIVASKVRHDFGFLDGVWDARRQWDFTERVLRDFGYRFSEGRQDRSEHPFTCEISPGDVRVTTRINEHDLFLAMSGSFHEAGHALYQQGMLASDGRTPLRESPGTGIHESQSRLWEVHIGQSHAFWEHYFPVLQAEFPEKLRGVDLELFHAAVNRVAPSLIRTEADEVTYNLHIVLRFELEVALLEGSLAVRDLPAAWNAKMKEMLGIEPPDDARGCMQDVHWSEGAFGYFPSYSLGNIYSAMLMDRIERDIPELWTQVAAGDFKPLLGWLNERIHRHGRRHDTTTLLRMATGMEPTVAPILSRQERKYSVLYAL